MTDCCLEFCCFCSDTLPPDHRYATPPLRCETYDEAIAVIDTLKTGDLLLFHTSALISQAQRCILASYYDHVAVVLKTNVERGKRKEKLPYHLVPAKKCKPGYCACEFVYDKVERGEQGPEDGKGEEEEEEEEEEYSGRRSRAGKKGKQQRSKSRRGGGKKKGEKRGPKKSTRRKYRLELIEATGKGFHVYPLHQRLMRRMSIDNFVVVRSLQRPVTPKMQAKLEEFVMRYRGHCYLSNLLMMIPTRFLTAAHDRETEPPKTKVEMEREAESWTGTFFCSSA